MNSLSVPMSRRDQILISIFIATYFFCVGINICGNCPLKTYVRQFTQSIELFCGIEQSWNMFCPNPRDYSFHPYAIITFQDGSTALYEFPRPEKMNQLEETLRERVRKAFYDNMPWDDYSVFRPTLARHIARCFANPKNPPTQVSMCYNGDRVTLMENKMIPYGRPMRGAERKTFFVYQVSPEDFK